MDNEIVSGGPGCTLAVAARLMEEGYCLNVILNEHGLLEAGRGGAARAR